MIGWFSNGVEWGFGAFSLGFPIGCSGVGFLEEVFSQVLSGEGFSKDGFLGVPSGEGFLVFYIHLILDSVRILFKLVKGFL